MACAQHVQGAPSASVQMLEYLLKGNSTLKCGHGRQKHPQKHKKILFKIMYLPHFRFFRA
jgi:hypothetical protein